MITRLSMDEQLVAGPAADPADDGLLAEQAWRSGDAIAAMAAADRVLAAGVDPGAPGGRRGRGRGGRRRCAAGRGRPLARGRGRAGRHRGGVGARPGRAGRRAGRGRRRRGPRSGAGPPAAARPGPARAGRAASPGPAPWSTRCAAAFDGGDPAAGRAGRRHRAGRRAGLGPLGRAGGHRGRGRRRRPRRPAGPGRPAGPPEQPPPAAGRLAAAAHRAADRGQGDADRGRPHPGAAPQRGARRRGDGGAGPPLGQRARDGRRPGSGWPRWWPAPTWSCSCWTPGASCRSARSGSSAAERDDIVEAMRAAVPRAGSPWWAVAAEHRWELERAIAADDAAAAADGRRPARPRWPAEHPAVAATPRPRPPGRRCSPAGCPRPPWPRPATRLAAAGRRWEAAALCRAAVARAADPAAARELAGTGRALRSAPAPGRGTAAPASCPSGNARWAPW